MTTLTIPKELTKKGELVIIPREDYEEFSHWQKFMKSFKTYTPAAAEKRMIQKAREDYKKGRYLTIHELKRKLGIKS